MIKLNYLLFITFLLFNTCYSEGYSIRPLGDEHVIRNQGIKASIGIYVTFDKDLSQKVDVVSCSMDVYRNNELVLEEKMKSQKFNSSVIQFFNENMNNNDSIVIKDVIVDHDNRKVKLKPLSFVNKR